MLKREVAAAALADMRVYIGWGWQLDLFCRGGGGWAILQNYWDCGLALAVGFLAAVANICDRG